MTAPPKRHHARLAGLFVFVLLGFSALPAQAYLDPGSGSLIIQSIIGGVAALGITLKLYWHKLRVKFGGRSADKSEVQSRGDQPSTD
jgi:hypothetical protein